LLSLKKDTINKAWVCGQLFASQMWEEKGMNPRLRLFVSMKDTACKFLTSELKVNYLCA